MASDGWYSGPEDLEANRAVGEAAIEAGGTAVHPAGSGQSRAFRIVPRDGGTEHRATDDRAMGDLTRQGLAERCWAIEDSHRGLEQCCGVGRRRARSARARRDHIGMSTRAFLVAPERHFYATGISRDEAKARIVRGAVRAHIATPPHGLP